MRVQTRYLHYTKLQLRPIVIVQLYGGMYCDSVEYRDKLQQSRQFHLPYPVSIKVLLHCETLIILSKIRRFVGQDAVLQILQNAHRIRASDYRSSQNFYPMH